MSAKTALNGIIGRLMLAVPVKVFADIQITLHDTVGDKKDKEQLLATRNRRKARWRNSLRGSVGEQRRRQVDGDGAGQCGNDSGK